MTGPNDSEMNGLSQQPPSLVYCCPWFALLAYLFFFYFFFLLIIKIFLTSGTRDRAGVSASLEAHHWKLAWVSTICHETKQASLSNLYNINNSMPHFYTCAGGPQYCRGFWGGGVWPFFVIFGSLIVFLIHLVRCRRLRGTWENATGLLAGKSRY